MNNESDEPKFSDLLGKTLVKCTSKVGGEEICFEASDGRSYKLYHRQDCCESVTIDDICGDLADLVGSPITQAEENSSQDNPPGVDTSKEPYCYNDSVTWTFYCLATAKGQVVIRWYGASNGYYSEKVDFVQLA